jgi:hypothetical protein
MAKIDPRRWEEAFFTAAADRQRVDWPLHPFRRSTRCLSAAAFIASSNLRFFPEFFTEFDNSPPIV